VAPVEAEPEFTPPPGWPAVVVRGLWKRYDTKIAVAGIDLDVPRACFFGLVGPNGAGKTTMIRMLTGLLRPDAGQLWVEGVDVWANPVVAKARIGVLPDEFRLFDRLSGAQLLEYCGLLRGMPPVLVAERSAELLDVLGLNEAADTLVIDYSTGMRKKIALASALLHAPEVLFLDEPFEAIDPVSTRTLRTVLERFTDTGNTVVFSSHVMEVVERLCDRVGVVHLGRLIAEGPIDDLRAGRRLEDVFVELVGGHEETGAALSWLGGNRPEVAPPPPPTPPPPTASPGAPPTPAG
jgi:ABC-2 type transport system ATP-binding protein